jgi:hypothetical protein
MECHSLSRRRLHGMGLGIGVLTWLVISSAKPAKGAQGCPMSRGTGKGKLNKKSPQGGRPSDSEKLK